MSDTQVQTPAPAPMPEQTAPEVAAKATSAVSAGGNAKAPLKPKHQQKTITGADLRSQIYVEDGALFGLPDYLMFRREELQPGNEQRLTGKIMRNLTLPHPRFQDTFPAGFVAATLASHLMPSKDAVVQDITKEIDKIRVWEETGTHPDHQENIDRYREPYAALVKAWGERPDLPETYHEFWNNAARLYLLMGEALKTQHRHGDPSSYLHSLGMADVVPVQMARKLNISLEELTNTLQEGGLEGFAKRFNIDPAIVKEINDVVELAGKQELSANILQSWEAARDVESVNGIQLTDLNDKIAFGTMIRASLYTQLLPLIGSTMSEQAPPDVVRRESEIIRLLDELPQPLRDALYYTGTEIAFVSGPNLSNVEPELAMARGVNHTVPYGAGNNYGFRRIIISNMDNPSSLANTLHHEVSHILFPGELSKDEISKIDRLYKEGSQRLQKLCDRLDDWNIAPKAQKDAIAQEIREQFNTGQTGLDDVLNRGGARSMSMESLRKTAHHVLNELNPNSMGLAPYYNNPEMRAAEVFARYGALEYATMRDNPALLNFLSPQHMQAYHHIYLPHVESVVSTLKQENEKLPEPYRHLGLPPEFRLPQSQMQTLMPGSLQHQAADAAPQTAAAPPEEPSFTIDAATARYLLTHQQQAATMGMDAAARR